MSMLGTKWKLHGNGKTIRPGHVVAPEERLAWPLTIGVGMQHVVAMFGATFLVPIITGMPPATTLLFSGIGTLLFLVITKGRVPSYLGSSFAFIAPILASQQQFGVPGALGGVVLAGVVLALVGAVVQKFGAEWINRTMPPIVTGAIVALIGLNLAPAAKANFDKAPVTALVTLVTIILVSVLFRGILGRLSILVGVVVGYFTAMTRGEVDYSKMDAASWIGLPHFQTPEFHLGVVGLFVPVVLVLVAENVGHVKSVAAMTGRNLDDVSGRALMADGVATVLAGFGGGSGTTTYAENIGVMAATKVYSTAAYWVAGDLRHPAELLAQVRRTDRHRSRRRAGRRRDHAVRHDRRPGREDLGAEQGQLLQPHQPDHGRGCFDYRDRGLHVDHRRTEVHGHRTGLGRCLGGLPRHEGPGPLARDGRRAGDGDGGAAAGGEGSDERGGQEEREEGAAGFMCSAGGNPPRRTPSYDRRRRTISLTALPSKRPATFSVTGFMT